MRDLRKKITIPFRLLELLVLSIIFGLSLWTCSTKNLIGTEKVGSIFIDANIPGANIWLDDNSTGKKTPDTLENITVGKHKVSVRKESYNSNPEFDSVEVVEGSTVSVNFLLTNKVGAISVNSNPPGARIILDHKNTQESTPDTLDSVSVGNHIVTVEKEGYGTVPSLDTVEVIEDSLVSVDFILVEKRGNIFVNSNVSGAEIFLDYVSTGKLTPDTIFDLMVGNHVVSVKKSGYSVFPETTIVEVIESSVPTCNFVLSQNLGGLFVNSTPQGAEIYLNHQNSGKLTPSLFSLPEGNYIVSVAKSGYFSFPESAMVFLVKDSSIVINFTLTQKKGSIFVNSVPPGGDIILDYVYTGNTTPDTIFDLTVGEHIVSVAKAGYLCSPDSLMTMVNENQTSTSEFVLLDTLYGSLEVTSNMEGATICIDQKDTNQVTPYVFFNNVTIGTHIISIFKTGHSNGSPAKEVVNIATKDTVEVNFGLSPTQLGWSVGNITPDFKLQDDSLNWRRYYAYRGFVVMLNFWSTDCVNCMQELPYLQQIYEEYLADSLIILGVNDGGVFGNEGFEEIRQTREQKHLTFILLKGGKTSIKNDYELQTLGTPVTIIIDREGKVYYHKPGFQVGYEMKFKQKLNELFGK
jgi:thiol-disulfide isomerase/thioredoxin